MTELRLEGVHKTFPGGVVAIDELDLVFGAGQLTALLGPSGCGKTTLLRMIAGLEAPSRGTIWLDGKDITATPAHRRRFGMVFQSLALFPHMSVAENVAYSLAVARVERTARLARAQELLELVRLGEFSKRRIGELSGGQRQRVAIARALAQQPRMFLLDEPLSALDAKLREDMQVELRLLQRKLGVTTAVVTHDQREAMTIADRIVVMSEGRVEQVGAPTEVYAHPATEFVADFIGKANFIRGIARDGQVVVGGRKMRIEPPAPYVDGTPLTLACRPEATRLSSTPSSAANQLPGKVSFVRDVGPTREIFVDLGDDHVTCEVPSTELVDIELGDAVSVELPPAALRVFAGQQQRRPARTGPPAGASR